MRNPRRASGTTSEMPPVSGSFLPLGIVLPMTPSLGDVVLSPAVVSPVVVGQGLEAVVSAVVAVVVSPVVVPVAVSVVVPGVPVVVPVVVSTVVVSPVVLGQGLEAVLSSVVVSPAVVVAAMVV